VGNLRHRFSFYQQAQTLALAKGEIWADVE